MESGTGTGFRRQTQDYLRFLSDYLEVPIRMISTGTDRNDTIHLSED